MFAWRLNSKTESRDGEPCFFNPFATTTFLTPLQVSLAQESNAGACAIMTIVSDAGDITWNTEEAAAELISIAKETNLTPEHAHEAHHFFTNALAGE